jgi:mannosyltransferase
MPSRWTFHTLMLAVLLLAFGLTLGGLTLDGIWWDEVFSWNYSTGPFSNTLETRTDVHPPLYYMTLWLWNAWTGSQNIWMMRLSSVWMGLLSVALVYRLGWAWFERGWVALTAAVWLGTHSVMIYQLRDIRMYPLVVLLTLVSWWALLALASGAALRCDRLWCIGRVDGLYLLFYGVRGAGTGALSC